MLDTTGFPMLFDGAFGTYYFLLTGEKGIPELANLTAPARVEEIHRAYLAAGAQAIKANTFLANRLQFPDQEQLRRVIAAGWEIAQRAAQESGARVFADLGNIEGEDASVAYLEAAQLFCALGARDFLFETLSAFETILPAVAYIRTHCPNATIFVSFAVSQDGFSRKGISYRTLIGQAMHTAQVDAAGLNCVCGPSHMLSLLRALPPQEKPLIAMPNAGYPAPQGGRLVFEDNSAYFADRLADLYAAGADILGGCCGTTPAHIQLGAQTVAATRRRLPQVGGAGYTVTLPQMCGGLLRPTRKLLAVELDAPLDADCAFVVSAAATLRDAGVDLITVADSPLSRARADSVMTAARIKREVGIAAMPHMTCRDRNRIAIKASLLGAAFEGITHLLAITGDPPPGAETGVFSLNSFELIGYINQLMREILPEQPFCIAGALNVNARNFDAELRRAQKKLDNGAQLLLTQAIFSPHAEENFRQAARALDCTLLAGILPVSGYKNALFLHNEVAGIEIPPLLLAQLKDATPEAAREIAIAHSVGVAERLFAVADGFYIMTPLRKIEIVQGLVERIREKEQQNR